MTDTVMVRFEGDGSGVAELSWGQYEIWCVMRDKNDFLPIGGVRALPPGQTVADVADGLRFIMSRHQSLRTRLRWSSEGQASEGQASEGLPKQEVHARGEIALEVVDAGDRDPAEAAAAVVTRYMTTNFDYERDWPVRMAVITQHGAATHVAEIYCHLAMDGFGLAALRADLARHDRAGPAPAPVTAMQPLEQVRWQRGPAGRRAHDASMRHFERLAAGAPDHQFSELADKQQPRFWQVSYESPAGYLASRALAARLGLSTSSVLLAAYAMALSPLTASRSVAVALVVNNRFRPGFADSVSTLAQSFPCLIEVGDAPFEEVCRAGLARRTRGVQARLLRSGGQGRGEQADSGRARVGAGPGRVLQRPPDAQPRARRLGLRRCGRARRAAVAAGRAVAVDADLG